MDEIQRDDITDIPVLPLPVNEGDTSYKLALISRYNDDGTNVVLSYPKEIPYAEAVTEIRNNFKRNSADTQWQMMLPPGDQFHLDAPTTIGDYKQFSAEKKLYEEGYNTDLGEILWNGVVDFGKAVYSAGKEIGATVLSSDEKEMGRHAFNVLESSMRGVENFSSLVGMGEMFLQKKLYALVGSPEADQADYDAYLYMKGMAKQMADRAAGDMITEGGSPGMYGSLPGGEQILKAVQKDPNVPAASPEDIKDINNAALILDPSWLVPIPGMKLLEKAGAKMAGNSIARNFLPSVLATEVAPRMAFGALAKGGQALDYITRGIFNSMSNVVEGVAQGSVTDASRAAANAMARSLVYGGAFFTGGGALIKGAIAGKAARAIGETGLAALKGIEEGSARLGVIELSEDMATTAAVRAVAKGISRIMPPDSAFNAMKGIAEAGIHTGTFMGAIGAMQNDLAGDDPIKGFEEGFAGGAGFGLAAGAMMTPRIVGQANLERVARFFQNDSVGRPRERTFTATAADGTQVDIPINDMQGRMDLFNRTDIPLEQREMILSITRAHERAGGEVFFLDGSEEARARLSQAGLDAGKGFQIVDGPENRSIIVLDPNATDFSAATAAEEVFHSVFTDATAKEVWKGIGERLGTEDPVAIAGELTSFANKYIAQLDASPGGKPHADKLRKVLATGTAPGLSVEQQISTLTDIINEYSANYVGAALAGMKPSKINQPKINNIWDKVWDKATSNILSTFDRSRTGVSKDPVTGHFFDSGGQRIKSPAMEHIVERFVDAAREGKASIEPKDTVDGATYFDVRSKTFAESVEDFYEGKQTTKRGKEKILETWFADTTSAAKSFDGDSVYVITPELRDSGFIHGNLPKEGSTVFFQRVMSPQLVDHISRQVVNGRKVFEHPEVPKQWNDAVAAGRIITLDAWHNISRTTGDRTDSYYARANRWVRPLGTQQMPKGGLTGAYLDISRMWSNITELMKISPKTKQSFKEKGINRVEEFIPFAQRYFDNLSADAPVPTADLPGFTPEIRNAISKALDLSQRENTGDAQRFKNDNTFAADFLRKLPAAEVDLMGKRGTMRRDSVALGSIRLDRINAVSEFTLNGNPVTIRYNNDVPNLVRANFSPAGTKVEQLNDSVVMTDEVSGKRIITGPSGKAKLFDGDKVSIHDSAQAAIDRANKNSVAQARFSPAGGGFTPKVGDEVTVLIRGVEQKAKILQEHTSTGTAYGGSKYYRVDIPGSELISEMNVYPLKQKAAAVTQKMSLEQHIAQLQKLAGTARSTTASLVDSIEKMYNDGAVNIDAKNSFIAAVNGPGTQSMKGRNPARQEALNRLYAEIGMPELIKGQKPTASAEALPQPESIPTQPESQPESQPQNEVSKTPSSLWGGRMEEMYSLVEDTFSKKGIFSPVPKTPTSLKSLSSLREDIAKAFTPQVAERLTRGNTLVRREDVPLALETRTPAQRKKNNQEMLALARRENVIQFREQQRMEKLETRLDSLQQKQRKSANAERAKEIGKLLEQRDRMDAETNQMLQAEREAAKANAMVGEAMEGAARSRRSAGRSSAMEALLQERDMQGALMTRTLGRQRQVAERPRAEAFGPRVDQPIPAEVMPEAQATVPAGKIESTEVPVGINLFKTKSGKFKVLLSSGQAIGITDEYKDAVKLAQKYATKKLASRKSVR